MHTIVRMSHRVFAESESSPSCMTLLSLVSGGNFNSASAWIIALTEQPHPTSFAFETGYFCSILLRFSSLAAGEPK